MSLESLLAAKKDAEKPTNPTISDPTDPSAALDQKMAKSDVGSMEKMANDFHNHVSNLRKQTEAPVGSYISQRQRRLILKNGRTVLPTNGFFIPTSKEEYDMLEYFHEQNAGLVQRVDKTAE